MKTHIGRSALIINAVVALATITNRIIPPNIFSYLVMISGVIALLTFIPNNRRLGIILSYISLIASVCITSLAVWSMLQNPSPKVANILLYPLVISSLESAIGFIALICWASIPISNQHEIKQTKLENKPLRSSGKWNSHILRCVVLSFSIVLISGRWWTF